MRFFKLFLICPFKERNLAKKKDKFGGKSVKKLNSAEFMEFVFSKSGEAGICL